MSETPSSQEEKVRAFWARFAEMVRESGAKPPFDRWLVIRAEEYVAAHPGRRLAEQCPADVDAYLAELGRKPGVKGWQVRQAAHAIRMLLEMAGAPWVGGVDWAHWQASARDLRPSHPTAARDYGAVAPDGAPDAMPFAAIRAAHGPILERARATAGVRGLAIRTERTYLHWVMRFIGFYQNRDREKHGVRSCILRRATGLPSFGLEQQVSKQCARSKTDPAPPVADHRPLARLGALHRQPDSRGQAARPTAFQLVCPAVRSRIGLTEELRMNDIAKARSPGRREEEGL